MRTTPSRLTILQLRHIFLTEARTFIAYPFTFTFKRQFNIAQTHLGLLFSTQIHTDLMTSNDFEPER